MRWNGSGPFLSSGTPHQTSRSRQIQIWRSRENWTGPQQKDWDLTRQPHGSLDSACWSLQSHFNLSVAIELSCGLKQITSFWAPSLSPTMGWIDDLSKFQDCECSFRRHRTLSTIVYSVSPDAPVKTQSYPLLASCCLYPFGVKQVEWSYGKMHWLDMDNKWWQNTLELDNPVV